MHRAVEDRIVVWRSASTGLRRLLGVGERDGFDKESGPVCAPSRAARGAGNVGEHELTTLRQSLPAHACLCGVKQVLDKTTIYDPVNTPEDVEYFTNAGLEPLLQEVRPSQHDPRSRLLCDSC